MKVTPKKGYILASNFEVPKEKKGILLLKEESSHKGHMKVESMGVLYQEGQIVLPHPYKPKLQLEENLYLLDEDDIVATVELQ
jgi:hypothetical protein